MQLSPLALGAIILVLGAGIFLLTWILPRLVAPRDRQLPVNSSSPPALPLELSRHSDAVLLVQAGGRVVYSNLQARQMFGLTEGELNLDHLGRRARPSEAFWSLCAAEGQSRFLMSGRVIEGTSYAVPYDDGHLMLVTLRRPQLIAARAAAGADPGAIPPAGGGLSVLAEVNQAMTASLDMETTLRAILTSVEHLLPADSYELSLWDAESRMLVPYRLTGSGDASRRLEKCSEAFGARRGFPGVLALQRQALLIPDVDRYEGLPSPEGSAGYPFKSYLGVPLEAAGDLVGALELHSLNQFGFGEEELELLRLLSRQAALAIHNASLYEIEEQRAQELAGLAQLAQVVAAQHEPKDFYARLVETLDSLLDVEILGFWIFDEENRILKGQIPFQGVQSTAIEWTRIDLSEGSPAEGVWRAQEIVQSQSAPDDPLIQALGMQHLATAAGIQRTVLVPLATSGRGLGYLQVANKKNGSAFDQDDLRLLTIIAGQVAAIIENAELVKQSRRRAQRAESLRRIASLTVSSATLDEILKFSLQDVGRLLQADMAIVFLLDETKGELRLHKQSMLGVSPEVTVRLGRLSVDDPQVRQMVTSSQQPVLAADALAEKDVTSIYQVLATNLKAHSLMVAPLTIREHSIGEIILMSREPGFFQAGDLQTINAAAGQLAGAIERASLYAQTDESLRRRLDQLTSLSRISRELNTTLELERLLQRVLDESVLTTGADCGTIQLFELGTEDSPEADRTLPRTLMQLGCAPKGELHGLERLVLERGDTLIVNDFSPLQGVLEALRTGSPLGQPAHEGIQAAMVVPIGYQERVAGLIHLHARTPFRFDDTARDIAETLAIQAAIALGNAHRYQDQVRRNELLNRLSGALSSSLELDRILEVALEELKRALQASGVCAVLLDADRSPVLLSESPQVGAALPYNLPEVPLFAHLQETLGTLNVEDVAREPDLAPLSMFLEERGVCSLLALTMTAGSQVWGFLLAYSDQPTRFSAEEVGLARTISNQTSLAIQNARLYAETRDLSQDLERRVVERTSQLDRARQRTETLLGIITELTTSLDLEQVLNRTLKLVNQLVDAGQITVLIARPGEKKLHRLASLGYAGKPNLGGSVTSLDVDQGLAGWVIQARQSALVADVLQDPRWILLSGAHEQQHRSAMAVPLMVGAECLGVLLLYHQEVGHFSPDQLELVQATANQVAVAINNAELYRLIRDQAEDLGQMFRHQQEEASRSRAILEAVADGVLVTDASKNITLFNASAEQILGLQREHVIGKSLDHFIGLFGRAGQPWSETIQAWSQDPDSFEPGDLYAEQITLEDERVISVQLSPVSLRDSFLGTVSTFRDITHQVQLDRLKSEFVATVSHELRTPMTSIKGYVDIMLLGAAGELTPQQAEFLEIVRGNTERLAILVNDLLDISRLESGKVTLSLQPVQLEMLASEAVADLQARSQTERKPMRIETEHLQEVPPVLGDQERIRQIIDNLLDNAFSYTAPHGTILLRLEVVGEYVQVDVKDNGIGIALDAQPRIFERFYRGEHPYVLATSGTGLGLSIVQHLVGMHGGRIWFESSGIPGEGCTFSFTLPLAESANPALDLLGKGVGHRQNNQHLRVPED